MLHESRAPVRRDGSLGSVKCTTGVFGMCTRYEWCNIVEAFGCVPASAPRVHGTASDDVEEVGAAVPA